MQTRGIHKKYKTTSLNTKWLSLKAHYVSWLHLLFSIQKYKSWAFWPREMRVLAMCRFVIFVNPSLNHLIRFSMAMIHICTIAKSLQENVCYWRALLSIILCSVQFSALNCFTMFCILQQRLSSPWKLCYAARCQDYTAVHCFVSCVLQCQYLCNVQWTNLVCCVLCQRDEIVVQCTLQQTGRWRKRGEGGGGGGGGA